MCWGRLWLWWSALLAVLSLHSCGGDRFAASTLRQYLSEVVTEALDQHYADLNTRLDRIELSIERLGVSGSCGGGSISQRRISGASQRVIMCNVASWAIYRTGNGRFTVDDVDSQSCTHLVYQHAGLDDARNELRSLNPTLDLGTSGNPSSGNFAKFVGLKDANPAIKTIISVGGYVEGSKKYSAMARDPARRALFVASAVEFLQRHGFDGLDLNWQHPTQRGGVPEDKQNFLLLLEELREAFRPHSWLLTASLSARKGIVDAAYDLPRLSATLDLLHLQAFDYHGIWDRHTGHNAPLDRVTDSVNHYLQKGADPDKLVLGIPLYGNSYLLVNPARSGVGEPTAESGFPGPYTQVDGTIGYNGLCEMRADTSTGVRWNMRWDVTAKVSYFVKGKRWVSIEDERSVTHKVALVKRSRLAGVAVTSLDTDDFRGTCGERNKLLHTINRELQK